MGRSPLIEHFFVRSTMGSSIKYVSTLSLFLNPSPPALFYTYLTSIWPQFLTPSLPSRTLWMAPILLLPDYLLWIPISRFIRWHRDMTTSRLPKLFWLRIEFSLLLWLKFKKFISAMKKKCLGLPRLTKSSFTISKS